MSMRPRYYVGPYIACETLEKVVIDQAIGCTNKTCLRHRMAVASKFCPDCGCQTVPFPIQVNEPTVCVYALGDSLKDALSPVLVSDTQHCWIPNIQRDNPRDFYLEDDASQGVVEIADQAAEIAWFTKMFSTELFLVEEAYGRSKVAIKWGILWGNIVDVW